MMPRRVASTLRAFLAYPGTHLMLILLFAVALALPCLRAGLPGGYDASTHVRYQHHFTEQYWEGEGYPRWLAEANKGFGSPVFLIQYPVPYFATALIRPLASFDDDPYREGRELGLVAAILVALAGIACWVWIRTFASSAAALGGALSYVALPYFTMDLYVNTTIGELAALAGMPLALACAESAHSRRRSVFALGVVFAIVVMSNALLAMLFTPALFAYTIASGLQRDQTIAVSVGRFALAIALGIGLAAIYVVPVIAFRDLFDLDAMARNLPGFELSQYFLYVTPDSLGGLRMRVAMGCTVVLMLCASWGVYRIRRPGTLAMVCAATLAVSALTLVPGLGAELIGLSGYPSPSSSKWGAYSTAMALSCCSTLAVGLMAFAAAGGGRNYRSLALLLIACTSVMLMLPVGAPIWQAIPAMATIQFPNRLGSLLTVAVAGLVGSALGSDKVRAGGFRLSRSVFTVLFAVGTASVVGLASFRIDYSFRQDWSTARFDAGTDVDVMYRAYVPAEHLATFAGAMGARPDSYGSVAAQDDGTLRAWSSAQTRCARVTRETPRQLRVTSQCDQPSTLQIGQLNFPLWRLVRPTNHAGPEVIGTTSAGLMELRLPAGSTEALLVFSSGTVEKWGERISMFTALLLIIGYAIAWRHGTSTKESLDQP